MLHANILCYIEIPLLKLHILYVEGVSYWSLVQKTFRTPWVCSSHTYRTISRTGERDLPVVYFFLGPPFSQNQMICGGRGSWPRACLLKFSRYLWIIRYTHAREYQCVSVYDTSFSTRFLDDFFSYSFLREFNRDMRDWINNFCIIELGTFHERELSRLRRRVLLWYVPQISCTAKICAITNKAFFFLLVDFSGRYLVVFFFFFSFLSWRGTPRAQANIHS